MNKNSIVYEQDSFESLPRDLLGTLHFYTSRGFGLSANEKLGKPIKYWMEVLPSMLRKIQHGLTEDNSQSSVRLLKKIIDELSDLEKNTVIEKIISDR